jgi:hypothetical protein
MKITKRQLKILIREQIENEIIEEGLRDWFTTVFTGKQVQSALPTQAVGRNIKKEQILSVINNIFGSRDPQTFKDVFSILLTIYRDISLIPPEVFKWIGETGGPKIQDMHNITKDIPWGVIASKENLSDLLYNKINRVKSVK